MKLTGIEICDYKSLSSQWLDVEKRNNSYTTILIGKNETGKSNVLNALGVLSVYDNDLEINYSAIANQQNESKAVSVIYNVESENINAYRDAIDKKIIIPSDLLEKVTVENAQAEIYIREGETKFTSCWCFSLSKFSTKDYYFSSDENTQSVKIITKRDLADEEHGEYKELSPKDLEKSVYPVLCNYYETHMIRCSTWSASENHLIDQTIDLSAFAVKPSSFPALKNVFTLSGYSDNSAIQQIVEKIKTSPKDRKKLQKKLSHETTRYLNKKWPEHNILIDAEITEQQLIHVTVQDKDDLDNHFYMSERSQGFKQLVSLLLSLAISHETGKLKNSLIIIDEPEAFLHPSGIRYMLHELLKIGKDNYVFIATHSNFMIDGSCMERHYLATKSKGLTEVKQVSKESNLNDDELLQSAFGINAIRDFLPEKKLLVEGCSDKTLLAKMLHSINEHNKIAISNGNGSNITNLAALFGFHQVYPLVITDDDEDGQGYKKSIIKLGNGYSAETVYTIRDIVGDIVQGGTIEDTLPLDYIQSQTNKVLKDAKIDELPDIAINSQQPVCAQIKLHIQQNLSQDGLGKRQFKNTLDRIMEEVKTKLSAEYNVRNAKEKAPLLWKLGCGVIERFEL